MLAVTAVSVDPDNPLSGFRVGDHPDPQQRDGWTTVRLRAASLNHHDIWSLRGVGLTEDKLPMVLGCDGAGVDEQGNEVVVHAVIGDPDYRGDETLDPKRSLLFEVAVVAAELTEDCVVPSPFDARVAPAVATAVAAVARRDGVARR